MNIKEIILKDTLEESEMYAVIEEYILERKGKIVQINNLKNLDINNMMHQILYRQRFQMAFEAYVVAGAWLLKNKYND